ncbi:hypothetical protein ETU08_00055 [Apibacter muscae]|uniref:hypothetical protein n=1 Tax=Apibacter muscae TaxID=2509004 RepID=UPI0011AE1361|nr:hypothetical protein [Apibacter muscae]TWP31886.1 hypothetical protein ETU08_00055 [Apibacter muscae]
MSEDLKKYKHEALEMAIQDFEQFCKYAGVNIKQLKVCIERSKGYSVRKISMQLNIPRSTVDKIGRKCFKKEKAPINDA